jgi:hypothetical protein
VRRTRFLGVENARTRDSRAGGEITFFDPEASNQAREGQI